MLIDTLYGGDATDTFQPSIDKNIESVPDDAKWSPTKLNITEEDILPSHQAVLSALHHDEVDIRPRFFDNLSKEWVLVDTGAQVSCCPPCPGDCINPSLTLEAVDG